MTKLHVNQQQFMMLKTFANSDHSIDVGVKLDKAEVKSHMALLADRLHPNRRPGAYPPHGMDLMAPTSRRLSAKPTEYLHSLLEFLKEEDLTARAYSSSQVARNMEANSYSASVTAVREIEDAKKDLQKGHIVLNRIATQYASPQDVTKQDMVDLKMLEFSIGTVKTALRGIQKDRDTAFYYDASENIAVTARGLDQFHKQLRNVLPVMGMAL